MDICAGQLLERVHQNSRWVRRITDAFARRDIGLHLAIFAEPYLSLTLDGKKTIESRFSRNRCAPFDAISDGDIILMKAVGGPICGLVAVKRTWFFDLAFQSLDCIRGQFGPGICAEDAFWESRRGATYATLIELREPLAIAPLRCIKRDRRGWVSLRRRQMMFQF